MSDTKPAGPKKWAEDILTLMRDPSYRPLTYQELAEHFDTISDSNVYKLFCKQLNALEEIGQIARSKQDRYGLPEHMHMFRGKLSVHPRGFAFLISETPGLDDLFISEGELNGGLHGDVVIARVIKGTYPPPASAKPATGGRQQQSSGSDRPEGVVMRVITRGMTQVVGRVSEYGTTMVVAPDDKRIASEVWIPEGMRANAKEGMKVVVEITKYPDSKSVSRGRGVLEGKIIEILGDADAPGVDVLSIIRRFGLPEAFPDDVTQMAESVPDQVPADPSDPLGAAAWAGRRDLRNYKIITIDGEDAKDLDDAVHVIRLDNGNWELGVHIADVSYYVTEMSALDQEAYRRGTSVYLTDRVIPMLPKRLSNGICSLNPNVERLTLSCVMEIDATGDAIKYEIFPSVIKTIERMTYSNVRRILEPPVEPEAGAEDLDASLSYTEDLSKYQSLLERYSHMLSEFELMRELALILRRKRMNRGAIDFDFDEAKIIVDGEGRPVDIKLRERSIAEKIIEEFMLAANETVAAHISYLNVPSIYRIHEDPDSEKLLHFATFANNLGYTMRGGKGDRIHPRALQTLLKDIEGTKEEQIISKVLLRSMKQAKYSSTNEGHFGLAAEFYTHFTSPIRRYPDLIVHRVLRALYLSGNVLEPSLQTQWQDAMPDVARQSSERERLAVEAERAVESMKKAQYMQERIGENFKGVVSSITGFGFFVELPNTIEGLVRLADMNDDYYHFQEEHLMLVGERSGTTIKLGQEVLIRVAKVNVEEGQIDFALLKLYDDEGGEARKFARGENRDDPNWVPSTESQRRPGGRQNDGGGRGGARSGGSRSGDSRPSGDRDKKPFGRSGSSAGGQGFGSGSRGGKGSGKPNWGSNRNDHNASSSERPQESKPATASETGRDPSERQSHYGEVWTNVPSKPKRDGHRKGGPGNGGSGGGGSKSGGPRSGGPKSDSPKSGGAGKRKFVAPSMKRKKK